MKRFTHLAVGAAVLLLAASVYASAQVPTERPLLEGRGPVAVSIELNGATTPQEVFRTDIELRLRQNGVRVAEKADSNLQLVLQVGAGPTGYRIYVATLQLLEPMARLRDYQASVPKPASESWVPSDRWLHGRRHSWDSNVRICWKPQCELVRETSRMLSSTNTLLRTDESKGAASRRCSRRAARIVFT